MSRTKSPATVRFETMKALIERKLSTDPKWVEAAILSLYAKQTSDEQAGGETRHDNAQGFTSADARGLTFIAEFLKTGKHLTREKALGKYSAKLQKYAGQLARIAIAKQDAKAAMLVAARAPMPMQGSQNRCMCCGVIRCPDGCCCAC